MIFVLSDCLFIKNSFQATDSSIAILSYHGWGISSTPCCYKFFASSLIHRLIFYKANDFVVHRFRTRRTEMYTHMINSVANSPCECSFSCRLFSLMVKLICRFVPFCVINLCVLYLYSYLLPRAYGAKRDESNLY